MPALLRSNPLAYPAGIAPGWSPAHAVAPSTQLTCIASGANMIDLQKGIYAVPGGGTVISGIDGIIGPNTQLSGALDIISIGGRPTTNFGSVTLAAIFTIDTFNTTAANMFVLTSNGGGGWGLGYSATTGLLAGLIENVANKPTSLQLVVKTPYFAAMSVNGTAGIDYILTDLKTGKIVTATTTSGTPVNPSATSFIGSKGVNGAIKGGLAAVMWSSRYTEPSVLRQWAADPWSFWYPDPGDNWIAAQGAAGFPYWAVQNNTSIIGTGAY